MLPIYADAYADYWHTIEAELDDPAPISVFDIEGPHQEDDAYSEFLAASEE